MYTYISISIYGYIHIYVYIYIYIYIYILGIAPIESPTPWLSIDALTLTRGAMLATLIDEI